jgi:hypothetical protein
LADFEIVRYRATVKKNPGSDTEESSFHHNRGQQAT